MRLFKVRVIVGGLILLFVFLLLGKVALGSSQSWTQNNWIGGSGQTSFSDITKYISSTNVDTSSANKIVLSSAEMFSNTGFDSNITNWTGTQAYDLQDQFTTNRSAGSVNGTSAEPTGGTRTVTDTNNKIAISGNQLSLSTGAGSQDGLWYSSIARSSGKTLFFDMTSAGGTIEIGWDTNASGTVSDSIILDAFSQVLVRNQAGTSPAVGTNSGATYQGAVVMRSTGIYAFIKGGSYTNWTLLWQSNSGSGSGTPGLSVSTTTTATADNIKIPTYTWVPTPLVYDTFTRSDGSVGQSEATGPDSQTTSQVSWNGGAISGNKLVITPSVTGSELLTNPGLEGTYSSGIAPNVSNVGGTATSTKETTDVHGGSAAQKVAIPSEAANNAKLILGGSVANNTWVQGSVWIKVLSGRFDSLFILANDFSPSLTSRSVYSNPASYTQYFVTGRSTSTENYGIYVKNGFSTAGTYLIDDASLKALSLSSLFSTVNTSTSDVMINTDVTLTSGTQAGVVLNLDSASSPANFVIAYHDGTNAHLDKVVGGTYTSLINTAATYSAGATLRVIKTGTEYRLYYNNALIGTAQTISDAGIVSNTIHGIFSTYSENSFDNFAIWPRGTNGEYHSIPADDLTATYDTTHKRGASGGAAKVIAGGNDNNFYQNVNVASTSTHNIIAYAYTDGSAVTASDVQLASNGTLISTTYTQDSDNPGWYRLSGTLTGTESTISYGIQVKAGKTVWLDDFSLKPTTLTGTLTSSIYDTTYRSDWGTLTYSSSTPTNTSVSVKVMTSETSTFSTSFSSCSAISSGSSIASGGCGSSGRYVQYQVTLSTTDLNASPEVSSITINFDPGGNTYYVSQSLGNDSNDGLTTSTPWKTLSKVNSSILLAGDTVRLKKGDTWKEYLDISYSGVSGHPITFSSYGTGDLPKIATSIAFNDQSSWVDLGSNIWQTVYSGTTASELLSNTSFTTNTTGWYLYANSGNSASGSLSRTTTDGEFYSSTGGGKIAITNNGSISDDLQLFNTTGFTIEDDAYYQLSFYAKASSSFSIPSITLVQNGSPYATYSNSATPTVSTSWSYFRVFLKANAASTNARVNMYFGNAIPDGGTLYLDDISIKKFTPSEVLFPANDIGNISFNDGESYGHKKMTSTAELQTAGDFYYDKNSSNVDLYSVGNPALNYSSIELGAYQNSININANSYININNLHVLNSGVIGISSISGSNNLDISDNELSNIGGAIQYGTTRYGNAIQFSTFVSGNIHDITAERNKIWDIYDAAITNQGSTGDEYNIHYKNNVIWNSEMGIEIWLTGSGNLYNIYVDNNTIVNSGSQSSHADRSDPLVTPPQRAGALVFSHGNTATTHDIYIRNNILSGSTEKLMWFGSPFTSYTNLYVQNNLFWQDNSTDTILAWGSTSFSGSGALIGNYDRSHIVGTSSGYWEYDHSSVASDNVVADPMFVDPNNNDYSLRFPSLARNAGQFISGITTDYLGNSYYLMPDIGAFDYQMTNDSSVSTWVGKNDGGTLNFYNADATGLILTVPQSYSDSDSTFYIYKLSGDEVGTIVLPNGYERASDMYDLSAITDSQTKLDSFTQNPLTVSIRYGALNSSQIDEATLGIQSWDGTEWSLLTGCTVDRRNRTVSCQASHFSVFSLFGQRPGNSNNEVSNSCDPLSPAGNPTLFQINTTKTTATIYIAPPVMPYTNFYVFYSRKPNIWEYATEFKQGFTPGVISYTIKSLQPNTKYYFQIRSSNGCSYGNWSNRMTVTTSNNTFVKRYYNSVGKAVIKIIKNTAKSLTVKETYKEQPKEKTKEEVKPVKKFCILWWCFKK